MTWDEASILETMAGSRLLIINNQVEKVELLHPRIQAAMAKLCAEQPRARFSITQQYEQLNATIFLSVLHILLHLCIQSCNCKGVERPGT